MTLAPILADAVINPVPATIKLLDYPALTSVAGAVVFGSIMLVVSKYFDPTGGILTISVLVILGFLAVVAVAIIFTVPNDEITSATVGGLVAAFGGIVGFWIGRSKT